MLWIFSTVNTAGHTALQEGCDNQPDYPCYGYFLLLILLVILLYKKAVTTNRFIHIMYLFYCYYCWSYCFTRRLRQPTGLSILCIFSTVTTAGHTALQEGCDNQPDYPCYGYFLLLILLVILLYKKAVTTNRFIHIMYLFYCYYCWSYCFTRRLRQPTGLSILCIFSTVTTAGHAALHATYLCPSSLLYNEFLLLVFFLTLYITSFSI